MNEENQPDTLIYEIKAHLKEKNKPKKKAIWVKLTHRLLEKGGASFVVHTKQTEATTFLALEHLRDIIDEIKKQRHNKKITQRIDLSEESNK